MDTKKLRELRNKAEASARREAINELKDAIAHIRVREDDNARAAMTEAARCLGIISGVWNLWTDIHEGG